MKFRKFIAATVSTMLILTAFTGCNQKSASSEAPVKPSAPQTSKLLNLTAELTPNKIETVPDITVKSPAMTDFGVRLFKACSKDGKNTLVSPLSVLSALAMTANGARGETLSQIEQLLGMPIDGLNTYIRSYTDSLPQSEKYHLNLANSVWFANDNPALTVKDSFLQKTVDYYGADIYKAPFKKASTLDDINSWVNEKTEQMIPEILSEIPADMIMCLINALAFEAEWVTPYDEDAVTPGTFTTESGESREAEFMNGKVAKYIEDDKAVGFIKNYIDGKYAFAALLPNNGVTVAEYLKTLSGEKLNQLLSNATNDDVYANIPKFETEYSIEMNNILKSLGMTEAFIPDKADFSALGEVKNSNIFIGNVIHKTFIAVAEKGTRAGAATAVAVSSATSFNPVKPKHIRLDRPFIYMLIDCETDIPFFIGTLYDLK
ncbi:MAG: serpin family protein [Clostridia bacterium]|nr:serpin family protein [Clostridia bacterium]